MSRALIYMASSPQLGTAQRSALGRETKKNIPTTRRPPLSGVVLHEDHLRRAEPHLGEAGRLRHRVVSGGGSGANVTRAALDPAGRIHRFHLEIVRGVLVAEQEIIEVLERGKKH